MDIYDSLFDAVRSEYDTITLIKKANGAKSHLYDTETAVSAIFLSIFMGKVKFIGNFFLFHVKICPRLWK